MNRRCMLRTMLGGIAAAVGGSVLGRAVSVSDSLRFNVTVREASKKPLYTTNGEWRGANLYAENSAGEWTQIYPAPPLNVRVSNEADGSLLVTWERRERL